MTITSFASGTQSASVGTEHFLGDPNVAGEYALALDLSNLAANDVLEVRVYKKVATGGTARLCKPLVTFAGVQSGADSMVILSDWIANDLAESNAVRFSIKQTFGAAGRDFAWKVFRKTDQVDVTRILGTSLTEGAAGHIAAAFKKVFDVATPVLTAESVNQTGDAYARIGANGAGLTALGDTRLNNLDAAISTVLTKLLRYVRLLTRKDAFVAVDHSAELADINANSGTGVGAYANQTDSLEAVRDRGDAAWTTAIGFATINPDNAGIAAAQAAAAAAESAALDAEAAADATFGIAGDIADVTDRLGGMIEDVSGDRFTTKALEQAPSGGGEVEVDTEAIAAQTASTVVAALGAAGNVAYVRTSVTLKGDISQIVRGDAYTIGNERAFWFPVPSNLPYDLEAAELHCEFSRKKINNDVTIDHPAVSLQAIGDQQYIVIELLSAESARLRDEGDSLYEFFVEAWWFEGEEPTEDSPVTVLFGDLLKTIVF